MKNGCMMEQSAGSKCGFLSLYVRIMVVPSLFAAKIMTAEVFRNLNDGWSVPSARKTVVDSRATKGVECVAAAPGRREKLFTWGHVFCFGCAGGVGRKGLSCKGVVKVNYGVVSWLVEMMVVREVQNNVAIT